MNTRVKFVSVKYVKENTNIEANVDDSKIENVIFKAQDIYLQQTLGSNFYFHLMDAVTNTTLTTVEDELIRNYIQPMVAEYTFYEVFPFLNYKATNKAVSKQNSENSTPSELDEIKYLRSAILDVAQFYNARLTKHLCDFGMLYPDYANLVEQENLPRKSKPYFNGVYLPKSGMNTMTYLGTGAGGGGGTTGGSGTSGTSGISGDNGVNGIDGSSGSTGSSGSSGTSGSQGPAGAVGTSGSTGSSGSAGSAGSAGTSGTSITNAIASNGPTTIVNIWAGSQAEYTALGSYSSDTLYFIV